MVKIMSEERLKEINDKIPTQRILMSTLHLDFSIIDEKLELCNEVIRLRKRNKEIYDGFMATQEELSDYAEENDRLRAKIDKAVAYIKEQYKWIEESDNRWQPVLDNKKLLNILNGEDYE